MSRSKNYYQGVNLGRVQRSEYDDVKIRDHARQDAKLGESLKAVERAKNVMKKSLEADKQLFMKTGSQTTIKTPTQSQSNYSRSGTKPISLNSKTVTEPRVKRFSVTDMPSDLDRSVYQRGRTQPRPTSLHEISTDVTSPEVTPSKELGSHNNNMLESGLCYMGQAKTSHLKQSDTVTSPGVFERLNEHNLNVATEFDRRRIHPVNKSTIDSSKYGRSKSRTEVEKAVETRSRQRECGIGYVPEVSGKSDDLTVQEDREIKNKHTEQDTEQEQDVPTRFRKRSTIWETLSAPKHTSMTKSKRSQIEMEFTNSNMKSSKSSPALFSSTKVKASGSQGKAFIPGSGSVQGRQVDRFKDKQTATSKS